MGLKEELAREAEKFSKDVPDRVKLYLFDGRLYFLGMETCEELKGELPFYLFWCDECGSWAKDYVHGQTTGGWPDSDGEYLNCPKCGAKCDM